MKIKQVLLCRFGQRFLIDTHPDYIQILPSFFSSTFLSSFSSILLATFPILIKPVISRFSFLMASNSSLASFCVESSLIRHCCHFLRIPLSASSINSWNAGSFCNSWNLLPLSTSLNKSCLFGCIICCKSPLCIFKAYHFPR